MIRVQVAIIDDQRWPIQVFCELPRGTVRDAVYTAGVALRDPDCWQHYQPSVFGVKVDWQHPLQDGDRVELAPSLRIGPKERRRLLAARQPKKK